MPPPDLRADRQALTDDAKTWDQAAVDLQPPHHELGGVTLNGADDVTGLGSRMGIDTDYENVRSTFEKLLSQAGNYFFELAGQLNAIAAFYERQEQTTGSGFKKLEPGGSR